MDSGNKILRWTGWVLTVLIGVMMTASAAMKFASPPDVVEMTVNTLGYPEDILLPLGVVELTCALLYLIPRTTVLGAILLTGYLGGAIATHARIHDNFAVPAILGVVAWLGVYLRDPRLRALLPIRRSDAAG